ncbi:MAG: pyridoxal phosphate-dependent aminotransferase [Bryobacteraceae bacterium]|nr:pyridoxal phosphate-dependent aminotransferase [Bryobacteraceae bacterium]MDW8378667.1 pyridoxal phosphate-dependent aminotransferase [Bryobacterales bacterium]
MPADRILELRPTAVNRILSEVRKLQAQGVELVSLLRGEPDFRTPPHIVQAAKQALDQGRTSYPDNRGEKKLREAVAWKLERDNGLRYDPATEILITSGATFGLWAALAAILNPGDEVLLPEPIYDAYYSPIALAGGCVRSVAGRIVNGRFSIEVEHLQRACSPRTRALVLNTPWNPTGTVLTSQELAALGEFVCKNGLMLISDEIYEALLYGQARHVSPAALSPQLRRHTIVVNSLSKTYAMTGWRAGYCAAERQWIDAMFLVLQQASRGPATFVQDAAVAALTGPQDCVAEMRAEYARRREIVQKALEAVNGVRLLVPEGGFFALVDIGGLGLPSELVQRRLMQEFGVVVVPGSFYGPAGEGTLRVSFAAGGTVLEEGLQRLTKGLIRMYGERA